MKQLLNEEQSLVVGKFLMDKSLSNKELEVASLVCHGLSNAEIANALSVKEKTTKFHLTNIFKKLQVSSRAQMIVLVLSQVLSNSIDDVLIEQDELEVGLTEGQQEIVESLHPDLADQTKTSDETTNVSPKGMWS